MDPPGRTVVNFNIASNQIAPLIYYASLLGLNGIVQELVNNGYQEIMPISASLLTHTLEAIQRINAQGGRYVNALYSALFGGHKSVVDLLIKKEAGVNAQGGEFGKTL